VKSAAEIELKFGRGYPPLAIHGLKSRTNSPDQIRGDVSSNTFQPMLMIAPLTSKGLELELEGKVGSRPTSKIAWELMAQFGVNTLEKGK